MTSSKDKYKDCCSHLKICSKSATCYLGICIGRGCGGREAILDGGSHRTRQPLSTTSTPLPSSSTQPPIFLLQPPKCAEIFPHQFLRISSSQMTGPSIHHKTNVKFRYFGKRTVLDTGGLFFCLIDSSMKRTLPWIILGKHRHLLIFTSSLGKVDLM